MTPHLLAALLVGLLAGPLAHAEPACPAEAQPAWASASAREKKALLARCHPELAPTPVAPVVAVAPAAPAVEVAPAVLGPLKFSWGLDAVTEVYPEVGALVAGTLGARARLGALKPGRFRLSGIVEFMGVLVAQRREGPPPAYQPSFDLDFCFGCGARESAQPPGPPTPPPTSGLLVGVGAEAAYAQWARFEPFVRLTVDFAVARWEGGSPLADSTWAVAVGARLLRYAEVHVLVGRSFAGPVAVGFGLGFGDLTRP